MSAPHDTAGAARGPGHEERDVAFRPIVIAAAGLVVLLAVVFAAMVGLFDYLAARQARLSPPQNPLAAEGPRLPPEPRLQVQPIRDLRELRAAERAQLEGYAWVDRQAGVVRIPIDRAMELLAARAAGTGAPSP